MAYHKSRRRSQGRSNHFGHSFYLVDGLVHLTVMNRITACAPSNCIGRPSRLSTNKLNSHDRLSPRAGKRVHQAELSLPLSLRFSPSQHNTVTSPIVLTTVATSGPPSNGNSQIVSFVRPDPLVGADVDEASGVKPGIVQRQWCSCCPSSPECHFVFPLCK